MLPTKRKVPFHVIIFVLTSREKVHSVNLQVLQKKKALGFATIIFVAFDYNPELKPTVVLFASVTLR